MVEGKTLRKQPENYRKTTILLVGGFASFFSYKETGIDLVGAQEAAAMGSLLSPIG
jgi:hypothetical protein